MKKNANQLHEELTQRLITENYVDLKPVNKMEPTKKETWEEKFNNYINEAGDKSLNPIVNNEDKVNTKEQEEKVSADPKLKFEMETKQTGKFKISDGVENVESHNYDYSPKVDNINNVNAQEMMNGVYCEVKNDPNLTLEEAQAKAISNLAKDSMHYVKNGMFGVEGLGYQESAPGLGEVDNQMQVVKEGVKKALKEHFTGVSTTGNPNSFASMSGEVINSMLEKEGLNERTNSLDKFVNEMNKEEDLPLDETDVDEARQKAIEASQEAAGMEEEARPDYPDIDGDGDTKEPMAKAAKDKKKKMKKESIDTRLAEIGKAGEVTKMEAQLEFLSDHIDEKIERVNSINEDENLLELIDKKKIKQMQREIKLLEKRKGKMEKVYEKMCGKKYQRAEVVDEGSYPWDKCIDDQLDRGESKEEANKICGSIRAKYGE